MKPLPIRLLPLILLFLSVTGSQAQLKLPWEKSPPPKAQPAQPNTPQPADDEPPARINSPDGNTAVRIQQKAMPGTDGVTDFFTLEILQEGKVVARVPTEGYLISAYWSADGRLLAVNNRRGNSGDYLWVFSLPDGACLKKADDDTGTRWFETATQAIAAKIQNAKADDVYKSWLTAGGWSANGELLLNVRIRYRGEGVGVFNFSAPAAFKNGKWTTLPGTIQADP